jgi:hypothetical protein
MLKGEDVVLLLKLVGEPPDWTVRSLEAEAGIVEVTTRGAFHASKIVCDRSGSRRTRTTA